MNQTKKINIVFMGTPSFAIPVLKSLTENYNVTMVVSQPNKEKDRKGNLLDPPIKNFAKEHNIEVYQPIKIRKEYQPIIDKKPDIIITCAYGQIIPEEILNYPKFGCINVHGSILPKLRGGAPIHHAIINGDEYTGITIMYMDKAMDSGDIISQERLPIGENDTLDEIYEKMSQLGAELLIKTLPSIIDGTNQRIKQNEEEVTFGYNITKEEEKINFDTSCTNIHNQIRGLSSIPGAYCLLDESRLKVYKSIKTTTKSQAKPGTILDITKEGIYVSTKDYVIILTEIKLAGKKRCTVKEYINGIKKESYIGKVLK